MVNVSQKSPQSPLSFYADSVDDKAKLLTQLDELVKSRTLSSDDAIFGITGIAETIAKISEHLNGVGTEIPNALKLLWEEEATRRDAADANAKLAIEGAIEELRKEQQKLQSLTKKSSAGKASVAGKGLFAGSIGCTLGLAVGMALSSFVLFPRQLSASRGSDGVLLEWLSTPDGALLRRSFASGNKSVSECVSKARKSNPKASGDRKITCLLEIK